MDDTQIENNHIDDQQTEDENIVEQEDGQVSVKQLFFLLPRFRSFEHTQRIANNKSKEISSYQDEKRLHKLSTHFLIAIILVCVAILASINIKKIYF